MTGYTRQWDCRVCGEHQESMCWPDGAYVCERCLRPLMELICSQVFPGKRLFDGGIDPGYFEKKAYAYATALLGKGQHGRKKKVAA